MSMSIRVLYRAKGTHVLLNKQQQSPIFVLDIHTISVGTYHKSYRRDEGNAVHRCLPLLADRDCCNKIHTICLKGTEEMVVRKK